MLEGWALTEANRNILLHVRERGDGELEWEFFCECGKAGCESRIHLTLDAFITLRDGGNAVLAEGHHVSQVERAREVAEQARALRAQARHQVARAKKNLG